MRHSAVGAMPRTWQGLADIAVPFVSSRRPVCRISRQRPESSMSNHLIDSLLPADRDPSRACLALEDGRTWSYGDVSAMSARYAAAFAAIGVRAGDRVAVQVEKSPEALLLYLATVRAGAVFLPLNTAYTPTEVSYFLSDAAPALFVADPPRAQA